LREIQGWYNAPPRSLCSTIILQGRQITGDYPQEQFLVLT